VYQCVYIPVSEHFSFAKIIHPPDRCGISRSSFNCMIITRVHLVRGTIKVHLNVQFCHTKQCHRCLKLRECAIDILTAGMSTRAVAREFNVNFSTISHLKCNFWQYVQPRTTPAQDLQIHPFHLRDHLRRATRKADETVGLHNRRITAQTVRNRLREAHLHARRPHQGLDLTVVRLQWANAYLRWPLACWRSVSNRSL
jgi:hypothetical protein